MTLFSMLLFTLVNLYTCSLFMDVFWSPEIQILIDDWRAPRSHYSPALGGAVPPPPPSPPPIAPLRCPSDTPWNELAFVAPSRSRTAEPSVLYPLVESVLLHARGSAPPQRGSAPPAATRPPEGRGGAPLTDIQYSATHVHCSAQVFKSKVTTCTKLFEIKFRHLWDI